MTGPSMPIFIISGTGSSSAFYGGRIAINGPPMYNKNVSIFEVIMLACFGFAWPFSIHKSVTSRQTAGKSLVFLYILLLGYAAGILHKIYFSFDLVILLYIINGCMVLADIAIYYRNRGLESVIDL